LLLAETARGIAGNPRLLVMAVTWLAEHHGIVETDRLAKLAEKLRGRDSARLGLLLETAQEFIGADVFGQVLAVCQPWEQPEPLFDVDRRRPSLARLAQEGASPISRKWGLWAQPLDALKHGAMRPASWIAQHNPTFVLRSLLKRDVRSKVITALAEQGLTQVSETDLTRRAGCTRRAMHLALENLETSGLIVRKRQGRSYAISLCRAREPLLPVSR
jgi:biotin operon repressor